MRRSGLSLLLFLALWSGGIACADTICGSGAGATYSTTASGGHEDSKVVWGTSGALGSGNLPVHFCQALVTNNAASTVWFMLFDSATVPADATKPKLEMPVATNTTINTNTYPMLMVNGISVACSSTEGTKTVTSANDCNFVVTIAK